jgi:hypothetical protein
MKVIEWILWFVLAFAGIANVVVLALLHRTRKKIDALFIDMARALEHFRAESLGVWRCSCGAIFDSLLELDTHARESGGLLHGDAKE